MPEDFSKYNGEGTMLRKVQLRMLDILIEFDRICRKYDIPYWLEGGTLLGAVRHKGYIPWDDDLDICMERKDLRRLKTILKKELSEKYIYQDRFNDFNLPTVISKIREKGSIIKEEGSERLKYPGLFLDIIPVEKVFSFKVKNFLDYCYGHCVRSIHNRQKSLFDKMLSYLLYLPSLCLVSIVRLVSKFVPTSSIGHLYGFRSYDLVDKNDIYPLVEIEFEGHYFKCPFNSDKYLTCLFGDYMQVPPVENRMVHTTEIVFY
ncbi:MAG: LicD family protein [Bacteroidales bacterium]|nr:LicD family protein [Bacteroidales bacterium]